MPKTVIKSTQFIPETSDHLAPELAIVVGWSKEQGQVQIGVLDLLAPEFPGASVDNEVFDAINDYARRLLAPIVAGESLDVPEGFTTAQAMAVLGPSDLARDVLSEMTAGVHRGWFMTPDRAQINRLITTLRQARDGAYGKDA